MVVGGDGAGFVSHDFGDPHPLGAFWRGCSRTGVFWLIFLVCGLKRAWNHFRDKRGMVKTEQN